MSEKQIIDLRLKKVIYRSKEFFIKK